MVGADTLGVDAVDADAVGVDAVGVDAVGAGAVGEEAMSMAHLFPSRGKKVASRSPSSSRSRISESLES